MTSESRAARCAGGIDIQQTFRHLDIPVLGTFAHTYLQSMPVDVIKGYVSGLTQSKASGIDKRDENLMLLSCCTVDESGDIMKRQSLRKSQFFSWSRCFLQ